ncbi:MAG: hypothetical protein Q8R85_08130 [Bosea sp. (in: a-proteobacteria)]|uniref:hypothetical protein n=1 Tax=Bosea sp. (in: a-proteobacteria) TaxID=1871050 RepID=UPI0027351D56|nr:hypothetical protein [Bosea sp. (in: a-proteobacteria)]MDP3601113.1 hypothetical protein [Bosea sp. (in: a-proteobacteria)]
MAMNIGMVLFSGSGTAGPLHRRSERPLRRDILHDVAPLVAPLTASSKPEYQRQQR